MKGKLLGSVVGLFWILIGTALCTGCKEEVARDGDRAPIEVEIMVQFTDVEGNNLLSDVSTVATPSNPDPRLDLFIRTETDIPNSRLRFDHAYSIIENVLPHFPEGKLLLIQRTSFPLDLQRITLNMVCPKIFGDSVENQLNMFWTEIGIPGVPWFDAEFNSKSIEHWYYPHSRTRLLMVIIDKP